MASGAGSAALGGRNQGRRMGLDFVRKKKGGDGLGGGAKDDAKSDKVGAKLAKSENAVANLASAERVAETKPGQVDDSLDGARENEATPNWEYTGDGKEEKVNQLNKFAASLKKKGPMGMVITLIFGVGAIVGGSQAMQPFSLVEQFRETFNSMQTSASVRSNKWLRYQMNSGNVKDPVHTTVFGKKNFVITKKQRTKLEAQGIYIDDDFEGTGARVMKFDDGTGKLQIVAADEASAKKLTEMDLGKLSGDSALNMKYSDTAISFDKLYADNADFFNGYNKGSRTWKGAIANWFGTATINFLAKNKLTRNLFKNFQEEVAKINDGNTKKVATDMIAARAESDAEGSFETKNRGEGDPEMEVDAEGNETSTPKTDSEGNIEYKTEVDADGNAVKTDGGNGISKAGSLAEVESKMNAISGKYGKVTGVASAAANYTCMVANVVGGISLLVSASEALQVINLVTAYFEAIDKVKAGDGDNSPINELAGTLNESKTVTYATLEVDPENKANIDDNSSQEDIEKAFKNVEKKETGSAMTSSGIASLYGGGAVDVNDPSVKSFNFTSSINTILGGIGTSMTAFSGCAIAKMSAAVAGAVGDALEIAACVAGLLGAAFTFGASSAGCGPLVANIVTTIGVSVAAGVLIGGIISAITPVVAQILMRDLITDIGGEDLGNALTSGANMYMGNTHRSNGGSLANEQEYMAFAAAQQEVIAENAKYERATKDPFDATSQYTFLGTLVTQLQAFSSSNTIMSTLMSSASVVSSALTALTPTSSAVNIKDSLMTQAEYEKVCPYLASIGAVGDAYCNPYTITDMSTMNEAPGDVVDDLYDAGNFLSEKTEDGNVQIKADSKLAEYIVMCNNRTSAFGIADQNIANAAGNFMEVNSSSATFNNATNGAIGAIPIIGDTIDIVSNSKQIAHAGYISGESCVAGNTVDNVSAPDWEEAKMYQRFIEDQSLAETIGLIEESAVTAYLDEYYEENPLDQSYEGILARYSGLEKEDVVALLEIVEYGNYIANYDASTRYAFVENNEGGERIFFEENNEFEQVLGAPVYAVVYSDLRNRNFVA